MKSMNFDQFDRDRARMLEEKAKAAEEQREAAIRAMKAQVEAERVNKQQTRSYAEPMLEAIVQQDPRQPLTPDQIERAAIMAEIARRGLAAQQKQTAGEALARASALPNARLQQERLEDTLETAAPSRPAPRL